MRGLGLGSVGPRLRPPAGRGEVRRPVPHGGVYRRRQDVEVWRLASPSPSPTAAATETPTPTVAAPPTDAAPALLGRPLFGPAGAVGSHLQAPQAPGDPTWLPSGDANVVGEIIPVRAGFLATLKFGEAGYTLCFSTDLVHWDPATDPTRFVNKSSEPFVPFSAIPVKKGYAAGVCPEWGLCENGDGSHTDDWKEWYSADGVHWAKGIPAGLKLPAPRCPYDECHFNAAGLGTGYNGGDELTLAAVSVDGGRSWRKQGFADDGLGEAQIEHPAGMPFVALYSPLDGDSDMFTSTDARTWKRIEVPSDLTGALRITVYKGLVFASTGDALFVSRDGCATWEQVTDDVGDQPSGYAIVIVNGRIVLGEGNSGDEDVAPNAPGVVDWVGTFPN
jgi:hypothetical protein